MKQTFIAIFALCASFVADILKADTVKEYEAPKRTESDPFPAPANGYDYDRLKMENLGRGVVAVRINDDGDVAVSWRYLSKDPKEIGFNIYRNKELITSNPMTNATFFIDKGVCKGAKLGYEVRPVLRGHELKRGRGRWTVARDAPIGCFDIPIAPPADDTLPDGTTHGHHANDCSVGDMDGDGEYEFIVKWESNASRDNIGGYTGQTWFECIKVPSGRSLWKINIGYNINAGPHYQPFLVADFDGDGKAEMILRTAPGTVDGLGRTLQDDGTWFAGAKDAKAVSHVTDYRVNCHPLEAPEFLTVFNGDTGEAMDTVKYVPEFGNPWIWGDHLKSIGNRSHRFLATTAYLDGVHPSAVMCRGYYDRSCLAAWDWDGHNLRLRWFFDSESPRWKGKGFSCQGFHNVRAADIDFDGRDEIIYGSMCVDDDGTGMYTTRLGHGDQLHIVQATPEHIGMQIFTCHEHGDVGVNLRDARTGKCIWRVMSGFDVGNCLACDTDPANPGTEFFGASNIGAVSADGTHFGKARRTGAYYQTLRMAIWWQGDMSRDLLPGSDGVWRYWIRWRNTDHITPFVDCEANSGSKGNPCLVADFLGDWREEAAYRRSDNKAIRVYVSTFDTPYRFWSLMEDPCYRNGVAAENAGYNVCPEPSFYFGPDLKGHGIFFRGCNIP